MYVPKWLVEIDYSLNVCYNSRAKGVSGFGRTILAQTTTNALSTSIECSEAHGVRTFKRFRMHYLPLGKFNDMAAI